MQMDVVVDLLSTEISQDEYGIERETITSRGIFAQCESVTRAEFFGGGRSGLNPELVFTIFRGDYSGEPLLRYDGRVYAIYRTYMTDSDYIELYAERKGGTNGSSEQ